MQTFMHHVNKKKQPSISEGSCRSKNTC